jgi:zinc protease
VGDVSAEDVRAALQGLSTRWRKVDITLPQEAAIPSPEASKVYFYDIPGASQSVLRFGYPSLKRMDPDYDLAGVMNYRLGGGGFASRLTQELREGKGYTYDIGSDFTATAAEGTFMIFSGVRSNVTLEATQLIRDIMADYASTFTQEDLDVTRGFFIKSQARRFESPGAKLDVLSEIASYDLPNDFVVQQVAAVEVLTLAEIQALAGTLIRPDAMNYVIVGDAATQLPRLKSLGFGDPVVINEAVDALTR